MRYFREQGKSDHEVMETLEAKFGDSYQITTRKMVKLGGIFGVGRRTGVEYCGYIKEKASSIAGNNMDAGINSERSRRQQNSGKRSGQSNLQNTLEGAALHAGHAGHADEKNRDEILARFVKNKEVQRWLQETKLGQTNSEMGSATPFAASNQPPLGYSPEPPGPPESPSELQRELPSEGFEQHAVYGVGAAKTALPQPPQFEANRPEAEGNPSLNPFGMQATNSPVPSNVPTAARPQYSPPSDWAGHYAPHSVPPQAQTQAPAHERQENWTQERPASWPEEKQQGVWENAAQHRQYSGHPDYGQPYYDARAFPPAGQHIPNGFHAPAQGTHAPANQNSNYGPNYGSGQPMADDEESMFLRRLENLERKVERRNNDSEPSSLTQFRESLYQNEFPPFFADRLIAQIRRELPLEALEKIEGLWEHVLLYIAENMRFIDQKPHSRIMILVGPTGVGKTTTIAKLAARQCVEAMGGDKKIHLITLDNYRIGAQDQIRTYGEILGAKVDCVETQEGLASCIEQDQESDMILIDTMGRSPSDHMKLAEMRQFLESSGNCEIHLTMSATSGVSAMKEIITQFKPFGFRSVILTKLDELGRIGAVLATFLQEDIPLSYLTTGQKVPQDICPASALALFRNLVDVQLDWQSFEQKLQENMP